MKKFIIFVLSIFLLLPVGVNAEKAYTKITGNEKILPGANIVYTVILDRQLTKYDAEITYDRSLLNLVSVNEVKLDTVDKKFEVEKGNPIKLSVSSKSSAYIVYTIVMNAKNYLEKDGKLFLVIRKEQGAKSLIVDLKKIYNVEIVAKKKGFFILKCYL